MANGIFELDAQAIRDLIKFARNAPRDFLRSVRFVLNELAFQTRNAAMDEFRRTNTVRKESFLRASIRVTKARGSNIDDTTARVGTVKLPNTRGFIEQLQGERLPSRMPATYSRGDNLQSTVRPRYRLQSGREVHSPSDYGMGGKREVQWLQHADRKLRGKLFAVTQGERVRRGIYTITRGGQLRMVHAFETDNLYARRNPFLTRGAETMARNIDLNAVWADKLQRVLNPPRRR